MRPLSAATILVALSATAASAFPTSQEISACDNSTGRARLEACSIVIAHGETDRPDIIAKAYYNRATVYRTTGNFAASLPDYEKALSYQPAYEEAQRDRGIAHYAMKQYSAAIDDFTLALRMRSSDVSAYIWRGDAYMHSPIISSALSDYDRAISLSPNNADAYNGRCWARAVWGKELDTALADCNHALDLNPRSSGAYNSRGFVHYQNREDSAAIDDYTSSLDLNGRYAASLYMRGVVKNRAGQSGDDDIAAALAIDSKIAKTYKTYGVKP